MSLWLNKLMKVPVWIHHHFPKPETLMEMKSMFRDLNIHTVCEEAKCPNIAECFGAKTATFLILGDICTRNCAFCGVKKGIPLPPDIEEPKYVAKAAAKLGLSNVVITSVTRDDLPDKGVGQFVSTVMEIRKLDLMNQIPTIELLIPQLELRDLKEIIKLNPEIICHNIETVKRLYPVVRPSCDYYKSLELLCTVKEEAPNFITKSGFMLGLGETEDEIIEMMKDLRNNEVNILTIGQYLRPSGRQIPVMDYISPTQFFEYEKIAYSLGFKYVASGPYVRSSYKAQDALQKCKIVVEEVQ